MLQQYLPLAVLKLVSWVLGEEITPEVATVPTACGIETSHMAGRTSGHSKVATVPTACGIETYLLHFQYRKRKIVATVPTACGIETVTGTYNLSSPN